MKTRLSILNCQQLKWAIEADRAEVVLDIVEPKSVWRGYTRSFFSYNKELEHNTFGVSIFWCIKHKALNSLQVLLRDKRFTSKAIIQSALNSFVNMLEGLSASELPSYEPIMRLLYQVHVDNGGNLLPKGYLSLAMMTHDVAWVFKIINEVCLDLFEYDHLPLRRALQAENIDMVDMLLNTNEYRAYHLSFVVDKTGVVKSKTQEKILDEKMIFLDSVLDSIEKNHCQFAHYLMKHPKIGLAGSVKVLETLLSHTIGLSKRNGYSKAFEGSLKQVRILDFVLQYATSQNSETINKGIVQAIRQSQPMLLKTLISKKTIIRFTTQDRINDCLWYFTSNGIAQIPLSCVCVLLSCDYIKLSDKFFYVSQSEIKPNTMIENHILLGILKAGKAALLNRLSKKETIRFINPIVDFLGINLDEPQFSAQIDKLITKVESAQDEAVEEYSKRLFFSHQRINGIQTRLSRFQGSFDKLPDELLCQIVRYTL